MHPVLCCCVSISCRGNVFAVPLPSNNRLYVLHYSAFRHHVTLSYLMETQNDGDIGFWHQTLWSLLFSRAPCFLVHGCNCCWLLRIDRNLLHSKLRCKGTRLQRLIRYPLQYPAATVRSPRPPVPMTSFNNENWIGVWNVEWFKMCNNSESWSSEETPVGLEEPHWRVAGSVIHRNKITAQ